MRFLLPILLCAISVYAAEPGQRAPGFALPDSTGGVVDLYDFHGKPVVIEFMQTSCPHCQLFADTLDKVRAKYGDRVGIISVANPPDTTTTVAEFIKAHDIKYPVVFDMGQAAYSYVRSMNFDLPQVYLVDAKGIIFNHYSYNALTKNIIESDGLLAEIERLFRASAPSAPKPSVRPAAAPKK